MIYNCYEDKGLIHLTYSKNGKLFTDVSKFMPSLYFPLKTTRNTKFKAMDGTPLSKKTYSNTMEYNVNLYKLKASEAEYYGDINPIYQFIAQKFMNKTIKQDQVKIYNYDIEAFSLKTDAFIKPESADEPVKSITIQEYHTNKYYVFGYKEFIVKDLEIKDVDGNLKQTIPKENIIYKQCKNEIELLKRFVTFLKNKNVQVLTGWNIISYDNQYIFNRLRILGIENEFVKSCRENHEGVLFGKMQNLDYMKIYKQLKSDPMPSYSLNYVSEYEVNMNKFDMDNFRDSYINHYQEFIEYNIGDTTLVGMLEDKMNYITLMFSMASSFRCLPEDILHVTRYWNSYIYAYALSKNIIVDRMKEREKIPYVGGYVKQPKLGLSDWATLYDIESSYPTNNRRYNISPEMLIDFEKLPKNLHQLTAQHLLDSMERVYHKFKYHYRTESNADGKILKDPKKITEKKFNVLTLNHQFSDNAGLLDKIQYPHFVLFDIDEKIEENLRIRHIEDNKYLFLALSKRNLVDTSQKLFQGHNSMIIMKHTFLTLDLIEYFSEDMEKFSPFYKDIKKHNYIITPNLQFFKRTKEPGILPKTQEIIFFERLAAKKREQVDKSLIGITNEFVKKDFKLSKDEFIDLGMKNIPEEQRNILLQTLKSRDKDIIKDANVKYCDMKVKDNIENIAKKIAINGVYGATGNEGFRFNDIRLCESTTSTAQLALRGCARYLEQHFNLKTNKEGYIEWLYTDTDSWLGNSSNVGIIKGNDHQTYLNFVEYLTNDVEPAIKHYYEELKEITNARDVDIKMDREVIIRRGLFTGKKHYYWDCYELDGVVYKDGISKTRGLETRQASTPKWVSKVLDSFLQRLFKNPSQKELMNYINSAEKHFKTMEFIDIAKSMSTGKLNDYKSIDHPGLGPNYKGSITYNNWLKKNDKEKKYEPIKQGEKVKWCYVKSNKLKTNAIAVPPKYHPDFVKDFEIDINRQFEATIMGMVNTVFRSCGWTFNNRKRLL